MVVFIVSILYGLWFSIGGFAYNGLVMVFNGLIVLLYASMMVLGNFIIWQWFNSLWN